MGGGDAGRDMRFHVGGECAGLDMQSALRGVIDHRGVDSCHIDDRRAAERRRKPARPDRIAVEALAAFSDDRTRDKGRARNKARRQAARDPEADDGRRFVRGGRIQRARQADAIAAAGHDDDLRASRKFRLRPKAGDGDDRQASYIPAKIDR